MASEDADTDDEFAAAVLAAQQADDARKAGLAAGLVGKRKRGGSSSAPAPPVSAKSRLIEGLSTAISDSNRGFSLLLKAGWKPGTGSGKDGSGRTEPVPVDVYQTTRSGIGSDDRTGHGLPSLSSKRDTVAERGDAYEGDMDTNKWRNLLVQRSSSIGVQRTLNSACKQLRSLSSATRESCDVRPELDVNMLPNEHSIDAFLGDPSGDAARRLLALWQNELQHDSIQAHASKGSALALTVLPAVDSQQATGTHASPEVPAPTAHGTLDRADVVAQSHASDTAVLVATGSSDTAPRPESKLDADVIVSLAADYATADAAGRLRRVLERMRAAYC
jgi:hypothetical protein